MTMVFIVGVVCGSTGSTLVHLVGKMLKTRRELGALVAAAQYTYEQDRRDNVGGGAYRVMRPPTCPTYRVMRLVQPESPVCPRCWRRYTTSPGAR